MLKKTKNVNLILMLFVITLFQLTCLFTLVSKAADEHKMGIILTFGIYILVEYIYFIGTRLVLKRKGFEVELIAFLLTSIGLSITASVYPDKALKQLVAVLIGIFGFVFLQWL
ncbi:MAG: hypothetical protein IKU66_04480, partial [Clostridia bacterium]|nr:hypothetical protein [Clostridia bacterium]